VPVVSGGGSSNGYDLNQLIANENGKGGGNSGKDNSNRGEAEENTTPEQQGSPAMEAMDSSSFNDEGAAHEGHGAGGGSEGDHGGPDA
jgi:hypothetical protein